MYFINKIKTDFNNEDITMFVDMDGVIADFDLGMPLNFLNKRPLLTNIKTIKEFTYLKNIELSILSICRNDFQIEEKNQWLDKHASFFKKEMRNIISKESNPNISSKKLKCNFLKEYILNHTTKKVILIDDDLEVLRYINQNIDNIILYQDSSIID